MATPLAARTEAHLIDAEHVLSKCPDDCEEIEGAIALLNRAIFLSPMEDRLFETRAEAFALLADTESAIADLRYIVLRNSGLPKVRHRLAELLVLKGHEHDDEERACECFLEAASLDPLCANYWTKCAMSKAKLGDFHEALKHANRAIDIHQAAEQYILRAKIHWALGLTEAGVKDMRTAEAYDPTHAEVVSFAERVLATTASLYKAATVAMSRNDQKSAIASLTSALHLTPNDCKLAITRAAAYRIDGNLDCALSDLEKVADDYREARRQDGSSSEGEEYEPFQLVRQRNLVLNELALSACSQGHHDEALSIMNRVIFAEKRLVARGECDAVNFRFYINRGDCYHHLGKIDCATADFRKAYELSSTDSDVRTRLSVSHYNVATELFNDGDFRQAHVEFSEAIKLNSQVARYFAGRGVASYHRENYDSAAQDFREALRIDPTLDEIRTRLQQFDNKEAAQSSKTFDLPSLEKPQAASTTTLVSSSRIAEHQIPRGFRRGSFGQKHMTTLHRKATSKQKVTRKNVVASTTPPKLTDAISASRRARDKVEALRKTRSIAQRGTAADVMSSAQISRRYAA